MPDKSLKELTKDWLKMTGEEFYNLHGFWWMPPVDILRITCREIYSPKGRL